MREDTTGAAGGVGCDDCVEPSCSRELGGLAVVLFKASQSWFGTFFEQGLACAKSGGICPQ